MQQTGRFIVRTLFRQLGPRAAGSAWTGWKALESLVEMACLMHDVGNPPFGHFGEYAINDWFERNLDALFERRVPPGQGDGLLQQRMLTDLKHFEGNAQAIRLVVKLLRLNLTYTQTAGLLKYVRPAYEPKPDKAAANHYLNKKPGFYLSEKPSSTNCAKSSACARALATLWPTSWKRPTISPIAWPISKTRWKKASSTSVNWRICW